MAPGQSELINIDECRRRYANIGQDLFPIRRDHLGHVEHGRESGDDLRIVHLGRGSYCHVCFALASYTNTTLDRLHRDGQRTDTADSSRHCYRSLASSVASSRSRSPIGWQG